MRTINEWANEFRQWRVPADFRIAQLRGPSGFPRFEEILKALESVSEPKPREDPAASAVPSQVVQAFSELATQTWRAQLKMLEPGSAQPREEMKRVHRHIEAILDALKGLGVKITEHTGIVFHSGMALKVIAFQPTYGLQREQVVETIKPSIHWKNQLIQQGEVIVGTPATASPSAQTKGAAP